MAQTKCITANAVVNDNSTILSGGNVTGTGINQLTNLQNIESVSNYGSRVAAPFGVASSGNIGAFKPIPGGTFAYHDNEEFIGIMLTDKIAGVASTVNDSPASDKGTKAKPWKGYTREGISDISVFTGEATYNAGRGVAILASGMDGVVGPTADEVANPTMSNPGQLSYQKTGKVPTQDTYKASNAT